MIISSTYTIEIQCDDKRCPSREPCGYPARQEFHGDDRHAAEWQARDEGWNIARDGNATCPHCIEENEDAAALAAERGAAVPK